MLRNKPLTLVNNTTYLRLQSRKVCGTVILFLNHHWFSLNHQVIRCAPRDIFVDLFSLSPYNMDQKEKSVRRKSTQFSSGAQRKYPPFCRLTIISMIILSSGSMQRIHKISRQVVKQQLGLHNSSSGIKSFQSALLHLGRYLAICNPVSKYFNYAFKGYIPHRAQYSRFHILSLAQLLGFLLRKRPQNGIRFDLVELVTCNLT